MGEAVGIIEIYGLAAAFVAADAGCKAAQVILEEFDRNKPANAEELPVPLIVIVKFRGGVEDVTAAVRAAVLKAEEVSGVITSYIIPHPSEDTEKMLMISGMDKAVKTNYQEGAK